MKTINTRRSIRKYTDAAVSEKLLRRLLSEVMSGKLENDRETLLRRAQQLTEK